MKIDIPLKCPKCLGSMYSVCYDAPLKILKRRVWQICNACGFERDAEDFKRELCSI